MVRVPNDRGVHPGGGHSRGIILPHDETLDAATLPADNPRANSNGSPENAQNHPIVETG